jgi:predicted transcriptional regulator
MIEALEKIRAAVGPQWRIADEFGISQTTVSAIKSGKRRAFG